MKTKLSIITATLLGTTLSLQAMQFQTIGYQAISMGGAGVANSSGSFATYNNPALLAKAKYDVEIALGGGLSTHDHGAGASMQSLEDSGFLDTVDKASNNVASLTQSDVDNLYTGKDVILGMDGNSVELSPQAYLAAQISNFGIGLFVTSDAVATANVDQAYDQLIFENSGAYWLLNEDNTLTASNVTDYQNTSMEYAFSNGLTNTQVKALAIAEVPIAYATDLDVGVGTLYVGGALKYMQGIAYTETFKIDNSGSAANDKVEQQSTSFGVDAGAAFTPSFLNDFTLGVVAKNINTPSFKITETQSVDVEPTVRVGAAYNITESLHIAADFDLTKNKTFSTTSDSQMLGGGLSFAPTSWFAIRGGLMQNLDAGDAAGVIYTAGLGIGLKWFQIDLSGQMSTKNESVNGTSYPQYAKANLALISRW